MNLALKQNKSELVKSIKGTIHFKELGPVIQKMFLDWNNLMVIHKALKEIEDTSYKQWVDKAKYRYNNAMVIKEIVINNLN